MSETPNTTTNHADCIDPSKVTQSLRYAKNTNGWKVTATVRYEDISASYTQPGVGHTRGVLHEAREVAIARATEALVWLATEG